MKTEPQGITLSLPVSGRTIAIAHTALSSVAFISALALGCYYHYYKLCRNSVARYPAEWFPSVSTTIGDFHPERSVFQLLIATCACPRFLTIFLYWNQTKEKHGAVANAHAILGLIRSFSCGGWSFVTSTDNALAHDAFMLTYIFCNLVYMPLGSALSQKRGSKTVRRCISIYFILSLFPMFYTYFQHKLSRIPGAYTRYAFFEWSLIIADIAFDSMFIQDLSDVYLYSSNSKADVTLQQKTPSSGRNSDVQLAEAKEQIRIQQEWFSSLDNRSANVIRLISYAAKTIMSLIWWTNFTALPLCIFYYSVWSLSFAGQEGLILVTLSASLIKYRPVRTFAASLNGSLLLHLLSLIGLIASKLEFPALKLAAVTIAVIAQTLRITTDWYTSNDESAIPSFLLGLLLHSVLKLTANSNSPFWPIMTELNGGYIYTGVCIGLLAAIVQRYYAIAHEIHIQDEYKGGGSCLLLGAGIGSYIWALHTYLSDPSTLLSWSWTGYPVQGPHPIYGSTAITAAFAMGALAPQYLATSHAWNLFGSCCLCLCYFCTGWMSAYGAFGCAVYYPSLARAVFSNIKDHRPGQTLAIVFGTYTALVIAHTFTVAYEFVPLGFLLRERSYAVMITANVIIWWTIAKHSRKESANGGKVLAVYVKILLLVTILTSHFVLKHRMNSYATPTPYHADAQIITSGIWTIHFGMDNEMRDSQVRMRDLIQEAEVDVLGLLETELQSVVFGNRNMAQFIAEDLGYYVDYGPPSHKHTWGAVLLSKFPIVRSTHHLLPSPQGELAPAIFAQLDVYGAIVNVMVSHNGQEESPIDRELQTTAIANMLSATYPEPAMFLGYLVTKPHDARPAPYKILYEDGKILDVEPLDKRRWCQYIGYRTMRKIGYARISHGSVTDTELQVAKFKLYDESEDYHPQFDWYTFLDEKDVPHSHRFSKAFEGRGMNGHKYHTLRIPIYYEEVIEDEES